MRNPRVGGRDWWVGKACYKPYQSSSIRKSLDETDFRFITGIIFMSFGAGKINGPDRAELYTAQAAETAIGPFNNQFTVFQLQIVLRTGLNAFSTFQARFIDFKVSVKNPSQCHWGKIVPEIHTGKNFDRQGKRAFLKSHLLFLPVGSTMEIAMWPSRSLSDHACEPSKPGTRRRPETKFPINYR